MHYGVEHTFSKFAENTKLERDRIVVLLFRVT